METEQVNIKPTYVSTLPPDSIDVSVTIQNKISKDLKDLDRPLIKGYPETPTIFYSREKNEFYTLKDNGDVYKVLRWRKQKSPNYSYDYVLIPYKRRKPIKILQTYWQKVIAGQ